MDRKNAGFEKEIYRYLKDNEKYLMNQAPAGKIGIFYSRQTRDVFGCSFTGITRDTESDCYQKIRTAHPILDDMDIDKTEMIMNEEKTLLCTKQRADYITVSTYVPLIYNQPPEYAWILDENTEYPVILARQYGKGRVVYFSNQTDKACFTNGHEDFVNTYRNAVQWAAGGELTVTAEAPEGVHIALTENYQTPEKKVISFVNTTSGPFRPVRSLQPVFHLEVRIQNAVLKEFVILKEESGIEVTQEEKQGKKQILIRVPMLQEFSAVYLDMEKGREEE